MGATGSLFSGFAGSDRNLARRASFERVLYADHPDVYERAFADVQKRAVHYATIVSNALTAAPVLTTAFPASPLGTQLRTVARMIGSRDSLGMSRQIFFVSAGGFDTHDAQLLNQPGLLSDVSASLLAFHRGDRRTRRGVERDDVHAVGLRPNADVKRRRQRSRVGWRAAGDRRFSEGPDLLRSVSSA